MRGEQGEVPRPRDAKQLGAEIPRDPYTTRGGWGVWKLKQRLQGTEDDGMPRDHLQGSEKK